MEVVGIVEKLATAVWDLKVTCDQHKANKSDAKELQDFFEDLQQCIPALEKRSHEGGINNVGNIMLKKLVRDINEAIDELDKWSANRSFFRIFNARERKQELENMHLKVMSSIQKNLAIATVSMLLNVQASQSTIIEQGKEVKSLLTASIARAQDWMLPKVRAEVVEASRSSFADEKFWQEVLAAIDSRHEASASREQNEWCLDPITAELMIDPVMASNGHTYCRWTIIDKDMTKDPFNPEEDLTIMVDNLSIRRELFEAHPEQHPKFLQRRLEYRCNALSLARNEWLGDAVVALQNVLRWNKNDKECAEVLVHVQGALEKAKGKYAQHSSVSVDQVSNYGTEKLCFQEITLSRALRPTKIMSEPTPIMSPKEKPIKDSLQYFKSKEPLFPGYSALCTSVLQRSVPSRYSELSLWCPRS
ncbi:hypothetical protein KC19_6G043000 [Ceratodon purpureus]|uniref:U-box domain-containing protein n=1 Tax=Ceratodon purpureus TaxID=3225 RepID=A0A8T0HBU8_CERPU|nr:hypothetical protein KC19_6G043000 [Ceratodon purpureus]